MTGEAWVGQQQREVVVSINRLLGRNVGECLWTGRTENMGLGRRRVSNDTIRRAEPEEEDRWDAYERWAYR